MIITLITWIIAFIIGAMTMAAVLWAVRILWKCLIEGVEWIDNGGNPFD